MEKTFSAIIGLIALFLACTFAYWQFGGTLKNGVKQKVVSESIAQYELVRNENNQQDMCMFAGAVALAMAGASDNAGYIKWKNIQQVDCKAMRVSAKFSAPRAKSALGLAHSNFMAASLHDQSRHP